MTEPVVLDGYCSAGGVGLALTELGIPHVGIDIKDYSDTYPGDFIQADCSSVESIVDGLNDKYGHVPEFRLSWWSPPCLAYSTLSYCNHENPKEVHPTISELNVHNIAEKFGADYIIENVPTCDDLESPVRINGHAVGHNLDLVRHFKTSFNCPHAIASGDGVKFNTRPENGTQSKIPLAKAKGVPTDWTSQEIRNAIPKGYVQHLLYHAGFDVPYPGESVQTML